MTDTTSFPVGTIFVQVAAYRDPQLVPTIEDCIARASHPENLSFGVLLQHGDGADIGERDVLQAYENDARFTIRKFPWHEAQGLCWARSLIQKMYRGEMYTMQLDSHHRFVQGWDELLISFMGLTGASKPILTTYAMPFTPSNYRYETDLAAAVPQKMLATRFTDHGTIMFVPSVIENWQQLTKPVPARFVSGHFFFTLGQHCNEYLYDPNIYFAGDEISLSIRSFTLGYSLFHPHRHILYHEYMRTGRVKQWDDHTTEAKQAGKIQRAWHETDASGKLRLRQMLQEEDNGLDLGPYGLGTVRSHHEYELYAGIHFKNRVLHRATKEGVAPPLTDALLQEDWFNKQEQTFNVRVLWDFKKITDIQRTKYGAQPFHMLYTAIEDEFHHVLHRTDLLPSTRPDVFSGQTQHYDVEIKCFQPPRSIIIWPMYVDGLNGPGWWLQDDKIIKPV